MAQAYDGNFHILTTLLRIVLLYLSRTVTLHIIKIPSVWLINNKILLALQNNMVPPFLPVLISLHFPFYVNELLAISIWRQFLHRSTYLCDVQVVII